MKTVCEYCQKCLNQCMWCNEFFEAVDIWRIKVYHKEVETNICDLIYRTGPQGEPNIRTDLLVCSTCWKLYRKQEGETYFFYGGVSKEKKAPINLKKSTNCLSCNIDITNCHSYELRPNEYSEEISCFCDNCMDMFIKWRETGKL